GADNETPVIGFLHPTVFPYDHRSDNIAALQVRNIETLDPARRSLEVESFFEFFADDSRRQCRRPKALKKRKTGVTVHQIDQLALEATLRRPDLDFSPSPIGQPLFQ